MGKSKKKRKPAAAAPRRVSGVGGQFRHDLALRDRARMALAGGLKPGQMPLLLDALDAAATPVRDHLEPFALVVSDLEEYRRSRRVGRDLARWAQFYGVSADTLLFNRENYLGMGAEDPHKGTLEERFMVAMYCAYRCTSGSTTDRHAYYASEEMTALILAGSETSADVSVTAADLPSPAGVAYLDQGSDEEGLVLMWHIAYDELLTVQLVPASGVDEFLANDGTHRPGWGYIHADCRYLPIPGIEAFLSAPDTDEPPVLRPVGGFTPTVHPDVPKEKRTLYQGWTAEQMLRVFLSFTHMIRQEKLVESSGIAVPAGKSSGVRTTRAVPPVTFLSYRRASSESAGPAKTGTSTRNYTRRWAVRGHWKRQWYPSENRHHPMWIESYIAGPEGAPLKTSDKVRLL
ncbi:hypothetical protein [Rhodococcus sp. (in: high G+C Gram-positive bacteria)]|uniref:hypothetical protein n=1 Tax=Rhodococcus sp. TaxID=1831 RepID=UPI003B8A6EA7